MNFLSGKKTYGVGVALIAYVLIQHFTGQPIDEPIVAAMLAGMGLTIRHGIKTGAK